MTLRRYSFLYYYILYSRLIRLPNLLIIALTQYLTAVSLTKGDAMALLTDHVLTLVVMGTMYIAAGGYVINDYYDVKIDAVNRPSRLVIDRFIKRRTALALHFALNILGLACGVVAGWRVLLVFTISGFLLWWYSNFLKRTPLVGNIAVAFLTSLTLYVVALHYGRVTPVVFSYILMAFLLSLVRELVKDMEDYRGDREYGAKTLPVVGGYLNAKKVVYAICVIMWVVQAFAAWFLASQVLWITTILLAPALAILVLLLYRADTVLAFARLSTYCKMIMMVGVLGLFWA